MGVADLETQYEPWLTDEDIRYYDFSSHCIYLKIDKSRLWPVLDHGLFPFSWRDRPFVVKLDGKNRYLGVFHSSLSSSGWRVPTIGDIENIMMYPKDVIQISWDILFHAEEDKRNDEVVKTNLAESGLYRAGLAVSLDWIEMVWNSDTATIRYQFTLSNKDDDDLYVVDPEVMGAGSFHYFNNGPAIVSTTTWAYYHSGYKTVVQPDPYDSWEPSWFVKLESHSSMTRIVTLEGYPHLPPDEYICEFRFIGPINIEANQRERPDGRYWLGPVISNPYLWDQRVGVQSNRRGTRPVGASGNVPVVRAERTERTKGGGAM